MKLSIISFTENGRRLSEYIVEELRERNNGNDKLCKLNEIEAVLYTKHKCDGSELLRLSGQTDISEQIVFVETSVGEWAKMQMQEKNAMLFIGACGIAVRAVAPYLTDKLHDSPVLVMDERGEYVIPILSGHMGGANELARYLGKRTGALPVITTATDINDKFAVDLFARKNGLSIINKEGIAQVSSKALAGEELTVSIEPGYERDLVWESGRKERRGGLPVGMRRVSYPPTQHVDIVVTSRIDSFDAAIILRPKEYAVGLGCKRGKSADEIDGFIQKKLQEYGIQATQVFALSSISRKSDEQGIIRWCRKADIPFYTYTAEELQAVEGEFKRSSFVQEQVGVDNVCERAALKACGANGRIICAKCSENGMTFALAKRENSVINRIYIVGMGPGRENMMTGEALCALEQADVIVGYTVYLNLLPSRFRDKELLSTPMRQEKERCRICFEKAGEGKSVALVCSGDAGIYGLASLMYETGQQYPETELVIVPGITAANSGAAVLGAPLNHDFCVISLSDLLTPWDKIEKRLKAAAEGDFVIVLYNPSSHKRKDYLMRACDILFNTVDGERPCGYVENIGREGMKAEVCTLRELRDREVNMFTTVFIGNSGSEIINGKLITKRGYQIERDYE